MAASDTPIKIDINKQYGKDRQLIQPSFGDKFINEIENIIDNLKAFKSKFDKSLEVDIRSSLIANREKIFNLESYNWYPSDTLSTLGKSLIKSENSSISSFANSVSDLIDRISIANKVSLTPKIICTEFQPDPTFFIMMNIVTAGSGLMGKLFGDIDSFFSNLTEIFSLQNIEKALDIENSDWGNIDNRTLSSIDKWYSLLTSGKWLTEYNFPFYNSKYYNIKGSTGWAANSLLGSILGGDSSGTGIIGHLMNQWGFNQLNIAGIPKFSLQTGEREESNIKTTFILYNDSIEAVKNNFNLLLHLVSSAYWVQDTIIQRGSNLFSINVSGRFSHYLCTLDLDINAVGKMRLLKKDTLDNFRSAIPDSNPNFKYLNKNTEFSKLRTTNSFFIPDAWKISLNFTPLSPDNFNNFALHWLNTKQKAGQNTGGERAIKYEERQTAYLENVFDILAGNSKK